MVAFFDSSFVGRVSGPMRKKLGQLLAPERRNLLRNTAWVAVPFASSQLIRLGSNVVIAWLLAPELLGLMLLINTLRTGAELLTDVGVGQSIVSQQRGGEPDFYNTAWTIQIIRGVILFLAAIAITPAIAHGYDDPQLLILLPAMAPIFLLSGLTSPARFLLQKRLAVRTQSLFDLALGIFGTIVQILLAWAMPTIWALILGLLIGAAGSTIASYFIMDWRTLRFRMDQESLNLIIKFGKWIFLSSIVYFFAMNFDRLYFAKSISFSLLGIYGIARTFSETIMLLFVRISQILIFPMIAASAQRGNDLRQRIMPIRFLVLSFVAVNLALATAIADEFIKFVYDARYEDAGIIMTILLIGTWFGILAAMADAIMMGVSKPAGVAYANGAKLLAIVIGLPLAFRNFGFLGCLAVLIFAECLRYAALVLGKRRIGLGFSRQDIGMTLCFLCFILIFREITMLIGLTEGLAGWIKQMEALDG
jgi:O-antigen/teichoic acid export membrane protein